MMIQEVDTARWVTTLEDEDLSDHTVIPVRHWLEFFTMKPGKMALSWDNLEYRKDTLWAVFSPVGQRYYLRHTRDRFDAQSYSIGLEKYYEDDNLFILLTDDQMDEMKKVFRRSHKHYIKQDGSFKYRDFYKLLSLHLAKDKYVQDHRGDYGWQTRSASYDKKIQSIFNKYIQK